MSCGSSDRALLSGRRSRARPFLLCRLMARRGLGRRCLHFAGPEPFPHRRVRLEAGADHNARIVSHPRRRPQCHPCARAETALEQRRSPCIARSVARLTKHNRYQAAAISRGAGDEIVTRGASVARLHTVAARERRQQAVMCPNSNFCDGCLRLREERRFVGKVTQQRLGEQRHVARRRDLLLGGKTVGIEEMRMRHAEARRRLIHLLDEGQFVAAECFGDGDRNVVGGAHDQRAQGVPERKRPANFQTEVCRGLFVRVGRDEDRGLLRRPVIANGDERQIGGHQLGERGGIPRRIEVFGIEDVAVCGVEHQSGACSRLPGAVRQH